MTRSPVISMTSLMQYFGKSLNKMSKLRLHEKANSVCRKALCLVVDVLADSSSDETVKCERYQILYSRYSGMNVMLLTFCTL